MANKWTVEQASAINSEGASLFLSAAAGSGKTAVLVERLMRIICDENNRTPADRLVVVTFTNDAAAQMRRRLSAALSDRIRSVGMNDWLMRQQGLLQSARICTIHSFCFDLIRENINSTEFSTGFGILDENESGLMVQKAVSDAVKAYFINSRENAESLYDCFCQKDDSPIKNIVLNLYKFTESVPDFESWKNKVISIDEDFWIKLFRNAISEEFESALAAVENALMYISSNPILSDIEPSVRADYDEIERMKIKLDSGNYDAANAVYDSFTAEFTRKSYKGIDKEAYKKEIDTFKKLYENYKSTYKTAIEKYGYTRNEIRADILRNNGIIEKLWEILTDVEKRLLEMKIKKNAISFSDAERIALSLLVDFDENGTPHKTPLCSELSEFYSIIMLDEFQDSSNIQEMFFKMLSKDGSSKNFGKNVFAVGDIKQSIYRFRLANPEIFKNAVSSAVPYSSDELTANTCIMLKHNFRSSRPVVDFVNDVFDCIMTEDVGDVDYTKERLVYAASDTSTAPAEVILFDKDMPVNRLSSANNSDDDDKKDENEEDIPAEAAAVAARIREMLDNGEEVCENGTTRPCKPADFCILFRKRGAIKPFIKELNRNGIKANADKLAGYLSSTEIAVMLNFLRIINNPTLDIPFTSVLMSPLVMLSAEDMAHIRLCSDGSIYSCVTAAALGGEEPWRLRCAEFLRQLGSLRLASGSMTIEKLIRTIYDSTDFLSVVRTYDDGLQKTANLQLLLEYARGYEQASNGGLSGFLRYIDNLAESESDLSAASVSASADDVVSVKSIHGSKGLEYPFVFLCSTYTGFNEKDFQSQMQTDYNMGISFRVTDKKEKRRYPLAMYAGIAKVGRDAMLSEEMRLLYVALTRAKSRLIITLNVENSYIAEAQKRITSAAFGSKASVPMLRRAKCMQDWLVTVLLRHKDSALLREKLESDASGAYGKSDIVFREYNYSESKAKSAVKKIYAQPDDKLVDELKNKIESRKSAVTEEITAKLTVSEISKGISEIMLAKPSFALKSGFTGAEKGVAAHTFMQYADFSAAEKDVHAEAARLAEYGYISPRQCSAIEYNRLEAFFRSPLYGKIKMSKDIRRERKFLMKISELDIGGELGEKYRETEGMLQGIADCVFEYNDKYILIDYKTDAVKSETELLDRYFVQLSLYKKALEKADKIEISDVYIYSFSLNTEIKLDIK